MSRIVVYAPSFPPPQGYLWVLEHTLLGFWPEWRPACRSRPPETVPFFRMMIQEGSQQLQFHTAELPLRDVPDVPDAKGASRHETLATIALAEKGGRIPVFVEIEAKLQNGTAASWYLVVLPDRKPGRD